VLLHIHADESKGDDVFTVSVPVLRSRGSFGTASVDWFVEDYENNTDLSPLQGTLTFNQGVTEMNIEFMILPDEVSFLHF